MLKPLFTISSNNTNEQKNNSFQLIHFGMAKEMAINKRKKF